MSEFRVGQKVELQDGRIARVHFVGTALFATGEWLGVELEDASGKNDGSVQGQRYFDCKPGYGMFVRPAAVAIVLEQPIPNLNRTAVARGDSAAVKSRPQSLAAPGLKKQNILDSGSARRQSINAGSPTPAKRGAPTSRLGSPTKSPTKQNASTSSSSGKATPPSASNSTFQKLTASSGLTKRTSMGPPSALSTNQRLSRQSIAGTMTGAVKVPGSSSSVSTRGTLKNLSIRPGATKKFSSASADSPLSASSGQRSPVENLEPGLLSPKAAQSQDEPLGRATSTFSRASAARGNSTRGRSPASSTQRGPSASAASSREVEDLKTKLRLIEKKRLDDREKLKNMEKLQAERDKFEGIIQKLQTRYQPLQQEVLDLKKQLKEEAIRFSTLEAQQAENETMVEVTTLDKEMAEETAESLRLELDALRQKHEETELEVEILREENEELAKEMSPEEKASQGWLQMERSNERLREALMRLRDITQQQESDLKNQVAELEQDLQELAMVKGENSQIKEKLAQAESIVEDLRQQLDTALGAEEMIEELTDKNFVLNEQIDSLKLTIEDLESLKELNDELEINHIETEKQLQDEIDYKETLLAEQSKKSALKDEAIYNLEYTVSRFRELVTNMHSDLEDMRASQQITESEADNMTSRSRAMMDLNMRLQVSASKAQVKAIDLELRRSDAQEAAEHLQIVQLFLPEAFKSERISVLAYLSFKRLGFKATMVHSFVKERVNEETPSGREEETLICCDILDKLVWISSMCARFVNSIQRSTLDEFGKLEGAQYELEPVERAFKGWIDGLRRDDLKEEQCVAELQRSIALMTHLGEKHISEGLEQHADDIHMRATMMQSHLENSAAALAQMKMIAQAKITPAAEGSEEEGEMQSFFRKIESLTMQARSAKVIAGKALNQLEELKSRALTLDHSTLPTVEHCQNSASELAASTRGAAMILAKLVNEEGRTTPLTYQEISNAISSNSTTLSSISSMIQATATLIQNFNNVASSLNQTVEFESPPPPTPWQLLAEKLRESSARSSTYKSDVGRLKDEIVEKNTALAIREKIVEEMSVKVEVLEKRVGESGGRRERVRELEAMIESAEEKEKSLLSQLRHQQLNLQELEVERDSWKKPVPLQHHNSSDHHQSQHSPSANQPATLTRIAALESEIRCLHSAIRCLRSRAATNHRSTSKAFISVPLAGQKIPMTPEQIHRAEAAENLRELVHLLSQPESRLVGLRVSKKEDRLKWKPTKETTDYALATQRGEWNVWREWGESVGRQRKVEMMNGQRTVPIFSNGKVRTGVKRELLFDKNCSGLNPVAKPIWGGQVRILDSGSGRSENLSEMERLTGFGEGA